MGGFGSGRHSRCKKKNITSKSLPLDIRKLNRENLLIPGTSFTSKWSSNGSEHASVSGSVYNDYLELEYSHKTENIRLRIDFDWTQCHYGGERAWFRCPFCNSRIAIIYCAGIYFTCRKCYDLTYQSCNSSDSQRLLDKIYKLRGKLGGEPILWSPIPLRPKGMHRQTYKMLSREIDLLTMSSNNQLFQKYESYP